MLFWMSTNVSFCSIIFFFISMNNKNILLLASLMSQAYKQEKKKHRFMLYAGALEKSSGKLLLSGKKENRGKNSFKISNRIKMTGNK